jgi:hypothetical protein
MRIVACVAASGLFLMACSGSPSAATPTPSPRPTAAVATSPVPSLAACQPASSYGLLLAGGNVEMIDTCGKVAAKQAVAPSSVQHCKSAAQAVLEPPVSATRDRVYFRDGDQKIRFFTLDGNTGDGTTVPGGPTTVSSFSVSPDDQRIAVFVEDLSPNATINERFYVEDLNGGGHHTELYSTSSASDVTGYTLWLMGWHEGQLVVAVMPACTNSPANLSPVEWHVVDSSTGNRIAAITATCANGLPGLLSLWPSPAGVACMNFYLTSLYDWTAKETLAFYSGINDNDAQTGISPSGARYFLSSLTYKSRCGGPPFTCVYDLHPFSELPRPLVGNAACLWIDEDHLLAADAVIDIRSLAGNRQLTSGVCAGRYPGGL